MVHALRRAAAAAMMLGGGMYGASNLAMLPSRPHLSTTASASASRYFHSTMEWNGKDRIIIVGDVHGCATDLENLLKRVDFSLERADKLVFVGDLVRKGPDSNRVVDIARECKALSVRGNHDDYALRDEKNKLGLSPENLHFLAQTPLSLSIPALNVLVVHAGMIPGKQRAEDVSPEDLMTMRNVDEHNSATLVKHGPGIELWAQRWEGPTHVVFGHDARTGLQQAKHATGLDTGCVYGRQLTALILPQFELVSVKSTRPDQFAKL